MEKHLNLDQLTQAMAARGLSQSALARSLSVSRESVRKWLNGENFPRPDKLLGLARALELSFQELVLRHDVAEPVVAFRKTRGSKTRDQHIENARTMGRMLRHLVPFLPFDVLAMPPVLKQPRLE
ncbi:MAG TPA: helix-turn-helix transcriptional regulator, partial [Wenzhouxiangella sp.]|nr:helix-turn-helix transcriptional regulator [Wenzhouxiangella sp.]